MLTMSDVRRDARIRREIDALAGAGHDITVVGVPSEHEVDLPARFLDVGGRSRLAAVRERRLPRHVRRAGRWLLLPEHRRSRERDFLTRAEQAAAGVGAVDVVHAHDFVTLQMAARLAGQWGARLVYDSHECWTGRRESGRPTPIRRLKQREHERRLGSRADAVLTVSDGIADWFAVRYGWRHVAVVRNTFPTQSREADAVQVTGAVYAGRIGFRRDLETVAQASRQLAPLVTDLVGPADAEFRSRFDPGGADVHAPVEIGDIDAWYRERGVALVTLADDCLNHRLALPNKLFQAVQAGVPVVATDLPAMREIVVSRGLGVLYRASDAEALVAAVRQVVDDHGYYRANVLAAQKDLSWDVDSRVLIDVYDRLASPGSPSEPTPAPGR